MWTRESINYGFFFFLLLCRDLYFNKFSCCSHFSLTYFFPSTLEVSLFSGRLIYVFDGLKTNNNNNNNWTLSFCLTFGSNYLILHSFPTYSGTKSIFVKLLRHIFNRLQSFKEKSFRAQLRFVLIRSLGEYFIVCSLYWKRLVAFFSAFPPPECFKSRMKLNINERAHCA